MPVPMTFPDYPFTPHRTEIRPGIAMSYLDEGPRDGEVVVMLHGNAAWSYYWRKLVLGLRDRYRCIVPDHIGMGLSDKPDDAPGAQPRYDYTLQSRVDDVDTLLQRLGITGPVTLAVHDWGGGIGFGWGVQHSDRIRRLVILNTGAFPLPAAKPLPKALRFGRDSALGTLVIRGFNAFSSVASFVGVEKKMPADVRRAYVAPYDSWAHRIATSRFVQDIPLDARDRAWPLVQAMARKLPEYVDRPVLIGLALIAIGLGTTFFYNYLANSGLLFGMSVPFGPNPGELNTAGVLPLMNIAVGIEVWGGLAIVILYLLSGIPKEGT